MPKNRKTISMRELARLCGTSRTTVDNALRILGGPAVFGVGSSGRTVVSIPAREALAIVRAYLANPPPVGRPRGVRSTSYRKQYERARRLAAR